MLKNLVFKVYKVFQYQCYWVMYQIHHTIYVNLLILDYKVLCEILLQRPFRWDSLGSLFSVRMNRKDLQYMTAQARDEFDKVMNVLKQMPSSLCIVIR
jgi:hypothetical protein